MRRSLFLLGLLSAAACDCGGGDPIHALRGQVEVTPSALDFGRVAVGNEYVLELTLRNTGEVALDVSSITIEGASFALLQSENLTLAPLQERTASIRFRPVSVGPFDGTATIQGDASQQPITVTLTGIGVEPGVEVTSIGAHCGDSPRSISFEGTSVGSASTRSISLKAIGSGPVTILGARIESTSGELTVAAPPAGTVLPPGASLSIDVTYQPADVGSDSGALIISTDAIGETEIRIPLCAVGTRSGLCGNPVPIDVGRIVVGMSGQVPFELKNCGNQAVDITGVAIATDALHASAPGLEAMAPALPQSLAPGATMSITVRYTPPALGVARGFLAVNNEFFPIVAHGVEACDLTALPPSIDFGTVAAGGSADRNLVMLNETDTTCTITRVEIVLASGTFTIPTPPTLPSGVAPGADHRLLVRYAPASALASNGMLEVEAGRSIRRIPLIGNSPVVPGCHLEASPSPVAFGIVGINQSATQMLTLRNTSTTDCNITSAGLDRAGDPGFVDPMIGATAIAPSQQLVLNLIYRPTAAGSGRGTLRIASNDATNPQLDVPLSATAQGPQICVMPRRLSFGNVQGSRDMQFQIIACGSTSVTVTALPFSRPDPQFVLTGAPALPLTLPSGGMQTITVRYTPTSQQGAVAAIDVRSSDPVAPSITVDLEGGAQIVPASAGRFLYYWRVTSGLFSSGGDVMRLPLQGMAAPQPYWGVSTGRQCSGCHALSPDGRYLALVDNSTNFGVEVIDTTTNRTVNLGFTVQNVLLISWRPNVNTVPPYQFAFDDGERILIASATGGLIGPLQGADQMGFKNKMPSWGSDGNIAFVRGTREATPLGVPAILGFGGSSDVMLVSENGGNPVPLSGASGNGRLNYYPSHSPNGRWIAFTTSAGASTYAATDARISLVAADNSGAAPNLGALNGGGGGSSFPTWSHDGAFLSFSSNRAGGLGDWDIWFAPIDPLTGVPGGAMNLREANTNEFDHVARWSP